MHSVRAIANSENLKGALYALQRGMLQIWSEIRVLLPRWQAGSADWNTYQRL